MGPDPVTGVLRRRRHGDTRESEVKTQGKDGPHKQGRETSLADADQTSSSRTEDIFLPSQPRACGPVMAVGPTRGRPHAVEEDVELNPSGPDPTPRSPRLAPLHHTLPALPPRAPSSRHPGAPRARDRRRSPY